MRNLSRTIALRTPSTYSPAGSASTSLTFSEKSSTEGFSHIFITWLSMMPRFSAMFWKLSASSLVPTPSMSSVSP